MGRVKVTPKGKVKKNIPITRIGKKQYMKRRFAHVRATDLAGQNNKLTQKYFEGNQTAEQNFIRLGLTLDPSATAQQRKEKKNKVKPHQKKVFEEEKEIEERTAWRKANKIARPVSEEEGTVINNLILKYGTDIKRMTMDPVLNPFQLNARQLQRQIVNYLKWERAAFPEQSKEAEEKGWFSLSQYEDNRLRSGVAAQLLQHEQQNKINNNNNNNNNKVEVEKEKETSSGKKVVNKNNITKTAAKKEKPSPKKTATKRKK